MATAITAGAATVTEAAGDTTRTTGATAGEKKTSRERNLRTANPKEAKDSQSRASTGRDRCTCCKYLVCICKQSSNISHAPIFSPVGDCRSLADQGYSPHGSETRGASGFTSRQTNALHGKLETDNARPMGLGNSSGLSHPLCIRSVPEAAAKTVMSLERGRSASGGRNPRDVGKGRDSRKSDEGEGLCIQSLSSAQEGRGSEARDKLEKAQRVCAYRALQDGRNPSIERSPKKRRLDDESGPEGCLLHGSDTQRGRDFLKFICRDKCYKFNYLPFDLACAPWVFTKVLKPVAAQLRELGVRMIVYIDDMLIIAETPELLRDHTMGLIYLLENLGFIIGYKKCVLEPTQSIDFLGFMVDSTKQELRLPAEKMKKIRAEARKPSTSASITARKLSQFLGKLNAATRAVPVAPLFYRSLQAALGRALTAGAQDYSVPVEVTPNMREEHLSQWNGGTLVTEKPSVVIETDASKKGWGATSQRGLDGGTLVEIRVQHAHQLPGSAGSLPGHQVFCSGSQKCDDPAQNGQHECHHICEQAWRHSVTELDSHNQESMALVPAERYISHSGTPTGSTEHDCR